MRRTLRLAGNTVLLVGGMMIGWWLFGLLDTWVARAHVVSRIETLLGSNESSSTDSTDGSQRY